MIQYPIARDLDGSPIHIGEWKRGQAVTCFGCGQDLVGRLPFDGIKPTAHFAHKADVACGGETALHKAAKAAISRSHANGALLALSWECPHCKRCLHQTDLRPFVLHEEASPCKGVVSDILGVDEWGTPCVAIEVVVTHDLEVETLERYRAMELYVFRIRPNWGIVGDIVRGIDPLLVDYRAGLVDTSACEGCQQVLREKEEWAARERAQKVKAWWNAWVFAWGYIGKEVRTLFENQQYMLRAQRTREQDWWKAWMPLWRRIAEQLVDTWWIEWRQLWRELGIQRMRPHNWHCAWQAAWKEIGKRYGADAWLFDKKKMERARLFAEEKRQENLRRQNWWPAWSRVWSEIGERVSGMIAMRQPICKRCRRDMTRDHTCP